MQGEGGTGGLLITGASGFIGSHVTRKLRVAFPDIPIFALGRLGEAASPNGVQGGLELNDRSQIRSVVDTARPQIVIHLAGQANVADALHSPWPSWRDNVIGTAWLAEAVREFSPKATFLFASTAEVYGRSFASGEALGEASPMLPANSYARGKVAAEFALQDIWSGSDGRLVIARIFNHVGPGQSERFVASSFAAQLARIELCGAAPVVRVGNLMVERDFGHIADLTNAIATLVRSRFALPQFSTFNICSGKVHTIQYILNTLIALSSAEPIVEVDPTLQRPDELQRVSGTHALLTSRTGWAPQHSLESGSAELLEAWRLTVPFE